MNHIDEIKKEVRKYSGTADIGFMKRVLGINDGNYGQDDITLGLNSESIKVVVKKYWDNTTLDETIELLHSRYHEDRSVALGILVTKYRKEKDIKEKKKIVDIYLANTKYINNWDLVDTTAPKILGEYCYEIKDTRLIEKLSKSKDMWEIRISIISLEKFVKCGDIDLLLELCQKHLKYPYHLINKAVGWMLREIGKKDEKVLINFLEKNIKDIPNITFSYATEKLDKEVKEKLKAKRK